MTPDISLHLRHAHSEAYAIASLPWPHAMLPLVGSQLYGLGLDEAIDHAVVRSINFGLDAGFQFVTIFAERYEDTPFEWREELDQAAGMLKSKGWRVSQSDAPLIGQPWQQGETTQE